MPDTVPVTLYVVFHLMQQPHRIGINLILQTGNLRLNEVNYLAQSHKQVNVILKDSKAFPSFYWPYCFLMLHLGRIGPRHSTPGYCFHQLKASLMPPLNQHLPEGNDIIGSAIYDWEKMNGFGSWPVLRSHCPGEREHRGVQLVLGHVEA